MVIAWGAFVRASGSGAGCGNHWPTCNGDVVPHSRVVATLIEFTHRVSSGLSGLLILALVLWAFRAHPPGHPVRRGAVLCGVFILTEGLIGAVLVRFGLVEHNASVARAVVGSLHLVNTFLLMAAVTCTALFAFGAPVPRLSGAGLPGVVLGLGLLAMLVLGVSGSVNALGDTLFPVGSLREGLAQDLSPTASFLLRLRVLHPLLAVGTGLYLMGSGFWLAARTRSATTRRAAILLASVYSLQLFAGLVNLLLLAPIWMQLVHLLGADLTWIALVNLAINLLGAPHPGSPPSSAKA